MKNLRKILIVAVLFSIRTAVQAQQMPAEMVSAIEKDDTTQLGKLISKENVNQCYGYYSVLSQTVRANAVNCFNLVIGKGADVNLSCAGYVPPLMHAIKYGHLEMVKALVAKGANVHYRLENQIDLPGGGPEKGETPLSYAVKFQRTEIEAYLRSIN
ncbi:ankyrin repeat domain-containing protein [Mucilaginibacter sp. UR6-11]|uniref:ankyrin repeat domain-containing protein n=1 Tax=Mucilaginibacter sp. UR6-11 TaxID=1435644 RepID=UPI001E5C182C|nr:ankyrin repeat domain-containing protein [Mucilaginibacter sp. UR6-11]MCC8423600.1 ankyrin repeat domain-containing protein [Mucilaginibacter sp. UR6-11]